MLCAFSWTMIWNSPVAVLLNSIGNTTVQNTLKLVNIDKNKISQHVTSVARYWLKANLHSVHLESSEYQIKNYIRLKINNSFAIFVCFSVSNVQNSVLRTSWSSLTSVKIWIVTYQASLPRTSRSGLTSVYTWITTRQVHLLNLVRQEA